MKEPETIKEIVTNTIKLRGRFVIERAAVAYSMSSKCRSDFAFRNEYCDLPLEYQLMWEHAVAATDQYLRDLEAEQRREGQIE